MNRKYFLLTQIELGTQIFRQFQVEDKIFIKEPNSNH